MKVNFPLKILSSIFLFSLFVCFRNIYGEAEFSGFIDTYNAVGIHNSSGFQSSRTDLKTNLSLTFPKSSLFLSTKIIKYNITKSFLEMQLKEVFLSFSLSENIEIRAGRQIFSWGNSERIMISDIVSPMDYREFITMDFNEMKMGVDSLLLTFFHNDLKLDLIWIPFFRQSRFAEKNDPWFFQKTTDNITDPTNILTVEKPALKIRNSQILGKLSFFLKGFDISLFGFSKWNDVPCISSYMSDGSDQTVKKFERLKGFGFYFSKPADFAVIRGEFVIFMDRFLRSPESDAGFFLRDYKKWLFGADFFLRNELKLSLQLIYNAVPGETGILLINKNEYLGNINISGKIGRGDFLKFNNYLYFLLNKKGLYNRMKLIFPINDSFYAMIGMDIFRGKKSFFGRYLNNSQIWVKLKYMF